MKSSKMLSLVMATMFIVTNTVTAQENTPMITDGVMDIEKYLFGDVDSNGQTILHRLAVNCDNDDFTVRLKLFDFVENVDKSEGAQLLQAKIAVLQSLPQEIVQGILLLEVNNFVQKRDNNNQTALDIAKKRNALNPHKRCDICVTTLEVFEKFDKEFIR